MARELPSIFPSEMVKPCALCNPGWVMVLALFNRYDSLTELIRAASTGYEVQGSLLGHEVDGLPGMDQETSAVPQNMSVESDLDGDMEDRGQQWMRARGCNDLSFRARACASYRPRPSPELTHYLSRKMTEIWTNQLRLPLLAWYPQCSARLRPSHQTPTRISWPSPPAGT